MAYLSAHGTMKPPLGAQLDPAHPFALGHVVSFFFNNFGDAVGPRAVWGTAANRTVALSGAANWASNREGSAYQFTDTASYLRIPNSAFMPTAAITILLIRTKTDTTHRSAATLHLSQVGASGAELIALHAPYSDHNTYWAFGGDTGANILTASGLSFSTTIPERWVLTAGPQGSAIWQNGLKVASQSTGISRTTRDGEPMYFQGSGKVGITGDLETKSFVSILNVQWADNLCQWWSAEPYAHLYPETLQRRYFLLGDLALPAAGHPTHYYAQQRQQAM